MGLKVMRSRCMNNLFVFLVLITVENSLSQRQLWNYGSKQQEKSMGALSHAETLLDNVNVLESDPTLREERDFMHSCEIGFENIKMVLKQKKKKKGDRVILDGTIKGQARPGRMLAIMGPSGSGKTTVLHALAGRMKANKHVTLSGQRYVNGVRLSGDSIIPSAFIEQETNFFPHMTVKETLDFRVELKLGKRLGKAARDDIVSDLMEALSLSKSANTPVGNSKIRGVSGGERRRLSIACEMISSPSVIFLDEPTSGLDSYQADQVIRTLRRLANTGKTIIAVIHQPSQRVFSMFDDLLLLSEGRQMYYGEVSKVRQYFETTLGYPCEKEVGTAEHIIDCISPVAGTNGNGNGNGNNNSEEVKKSHERLNHIATQAALEAQNIKLPSKNTSTSTSNNNKVIKLKRLHDLNQKRPSANIFQQFKLLLTRSVKDIFRGKAALIIKVVQQVTIALIYGGIYQLGDNQASIMDRMGLLNLIVIGGSNMAVASTIRSFPKEKTIISQEISSHLYGTFPYFIAKAISEFPPVGIFSALFGAILYPLVGLQKGRRRFQNFLGITTLNSLVALSNGLLVGSFAANEDVALALFPPILVISIIFDGKNISIENTPKILRWIPKLGLIRWAFEGLAINEFEGLTFKTSGPFKGPPTKTGQEALERFNLGSVTLADTIKAQVNLVAMCWGLSFIGLSLGKQKFQVMTDLPSK